MIRQFAELTRPETRVGFEPTSEELQSSALSDSLLRVDIVTGFT